jgi:hypothetical protein
MGMNKNKQEARVAEMLRLRAKNVTLDEIGRRFGLTRQRVHQLIGNELSGKEVIASRRADRQRQVDDLSEKVLAELRAGKRHSAEIRARFGLTQKEMVEISRSDQNAQREHVAALQRSKPTGAKLADLRGLKKAAKLVGHTPGTKKYNQMRREGEIEGPSSTWLSATYGSWAEACRQAKLPVNGRPSGESMGNRTYGNDQALALLIAAYENLGHWPSLAEWQGPPSAGWYRLRFKGWMRAIAAAQRKMYDESDERK